MIVPSAVPLVNVGDCGSPASAPLREIHHVSIHSRIPQTTARSTLASVHRRSRVEESREKRHLGVMS